MLSSKLAWNTLRDTLNFRKPLEKLIAELGTGQRPEVLREMSNFGSAGHMFKGMFGSFHYDMTHSTFGRQEAQTLAFESLVIATETDDLIDEGRIEPNEQIEIIRKVMDVLKSGKAVYTKYIQLNALSLLAQDLHRRIASAPYPSRFFEEYQALGDAAIRQIKGEVSQELTAELGGRSMGVCAIIPYLFRDDLPERFITAARDIGGYLQIYDDIADSAHDMNKGLKTLMTQDVTSADVLRKVKDFGKKLYKNGLMQLKESEQQAYVTLCFIVRARSLAKRYIYKVSK